MKNDGLSSKLKTFKKKKEEYSTRCQIGHELALNYGQLLGQLFGAMAAKALACVGERLLNRGCICWPYIDNKWAKALPIWALTSGVSTGDKATCAKTLTRSGTKGAICLK